MEIFVVILAIGFVFFAIGASVTLNDLVSRVSSLEANLAATREEVNSLKFSAGWTKAGIEVLYRAVGKAKVNHVLKTMKKEATKNLKKAKATNATKQTEPVTA